MGGKRAAVRIVQASKQRLTATQERNARKRAAKKRLKEAVVAQVKTDPSLRYIADPCKTPIVKQARAFFRNCGVHHFEVNIGPTTGWRTEAKLAVRKPHGASDGIEIGLFAPGTHDICRVDDCPAHHPAINEAVRLIESVCRDVGVRGYDEENGTGELRYIKVEVQRSTRKVQLTLVWHAASEVEAQPRLGSLVDELLQRHPTLWHSIWANFHPASKHVSRILAFDKAAWQRLAGKKKPLRERLLSCPCPYDHPELCFPPFVFRQANLCAFEDIVTAIRRFVVPRTRVVELYGGVGTIGLHLADLVASLKCSDENPHNQVCFERSVQALPEELASRLSYTTSDASSQVSSLRSADLVIVDPPRKGLDDPVVKALEKPSKHLQRLIYVSCGFAAFERDAGRLLSAGWKIAHAEGFVLFPGADHVETLCVFDAPSCVGKIPPPSGQAAGSFSRRRSRDTAESAQVESVAQARRRGGARWRKKQAALMKREAAANASGQRE